MLRSPLVLGALMSVMTPCASVLAHGDPPNAFAVLTHDAEGARAVRLSYGVGLRRAAQHFQFICPSAWGDQYGAPVAALADGTIVIGSTSGLKLLSDDGKVRAHPDPAALGDSSDVVRGARGVFSLRTTTAGSEVLAVEADRVRVLWRDTKTLYSLAPLDDKLVLLRGNGTTLEQVTIATVDGAELERQVAVVGSPVDYAYARAAAGVPYALVMFRTNAALGNLRMNTFTKLAEADLTIAGPLHVGEQTLIALDGKLSQLLEGGTQELAESAEVRCLEHDMELSYACNPDGIARIAGPALSEPLFKWSWLFGPDLEQLPAGEVRDRCNAQWQDFRIDLSAVGVSLPPDAPAIAGSPVDAGTPLPDAGPPDAGPDSHVPGLADGGQAAVLAPGTKDSGGCSALPCNRRAVDVNLAALVLGLTTFVRRRRARSHKNRPAADF